jgi:hypothetical protein
MKSRSVEESDLLMSCIRVEDEVRGNDSRDETRPEVRPRN